MQMRRVALGMSDFWSLKRTELRVFIQLEVQFGVRESLRKMSRRTSNVRSFRHRTMRTNACFAAVRSVRMIRAFTQLAAGSAHHSSETALHSAVFLPEGLVTRHGLFTAACPHGISDVRTYSTLVFAITGLIGPLLRLLTWPPGQFTDRFGETVASFVYDLVLLIWPTQPLAVMEASIGALAGVTVAIFGNVMLLGLLGLVVASFVTDKGLVFPFVATMIAIFLFALWMSGFSMAGVTLIAYVCAVCIYAIPFWLVRRFARRAAT